MNRNHEGSGIFGAKGASCTAAALYLFTNAQLYCTYGYFLSSLSVVPGAFQASAAAIIAALKSALCNAARYQPDSAAKYNKDALQNDVNLLLNENNVAENTLSRANVMPRSVRPDLAMLTRAPSSVTSSARCFFATIQLANDANDQLMSAAKPML